MMSHPFKIAAAAVGAASVVTMGVATIALSGTSAADPPRPGPVGTPAATTGETITAETAAPKEPATLKAAPGITGPAPLPVEEQGLPGD